ncbi:MAG: hypothetical protein JO081_00515 [Alphaproteobacteria bacterium]|nr:hypothetical protein [Alphaproteobacteria bacterium]
MTRYMGAAATVIASLLLLVTPIWAQAQLGGETEPAVPTSAKHQSISAIRGENSAEHLRHKLRDQANRGLVGIVSDGTDATTDMGFALAADGDGVRLLPISGSGAAQNVADVIFTRGIDFGIIQTDVLDEIKRNPPFPGVDKYLQYVTKFYDEQVHVLAGPDIQSLSDLQGKKVNFARPASGTYTTGTNIFKAVRVQPIVTTLPNPLALDQLRRGEISAMVYVGTKPSRMFQDIRPDEKIHFLAVIGDLPKDYMRATITSDDYPELVSQIAPVATVEVGTVLVAYNWPDKSERHTRVERFVRAFFMHLNQIKALRPKWHPFDVTSEVSGWTRFPGAERWLKKTGLITTSDRALAQLDPNQREQLFQAFAEYAKHAVVQLDPNQREALFRAFAAYEKQHRMVVAVHDVDVH